MNLLEFLVQCQYLRFSDRAIPIFKLREHKNMDVKLVLVVLTAVFTVACLFFGTKNGFYDSDDYHGNGSAH